MFMEDILKVADTLQGELKKIISSKKGSLLANKDEKNIIKLYCALQEFGEQILDWEVETFEIVLGRNGVSHDTILNVVGMVYLIRNQDYVLTHRAHFENAVQLLNDLYLDTSTTELQAPHLIWWAMIGLIILYHSKNFGVTGDALNYIAQSFKEYGWTQCPVFFIGTPLQHAFPETEAEYINSLKNMSYSEFAQLALKAGNLKEVQNGFQNYLKLHAPLIDYAQSEAGQILFHINKILHK